MSYLIYKTIEMYRYIFYELGDPRTNDWFMLSGPGIICAITAFYLAFCTSIGPRFMENRKPYDLKRALMLYNMVQIILSVIFLNECIRVLVSDYNFYCEPVDYSTSPKATRVTKAAWWYLLSKVLELFDTIFFILRKKEKQVTFLHLYHHSTTMLAVWVGTKYFPGGHAVVMCTLNSFVHTIMYTYYLIAGLGPAYQKYIWWKKHVTVLQLIQFVLVACHNINPLFDDCAYPKAMNTVMLSNSLLFLYLFGRFYIKTYRKSVKRKM